MKKYLKMWAGGIVAAVIALAQVASVSAWGPEDRKTFTNESPATYATFNSITNNAAVGDERDFVRIVERNTGDTYTSDLTIKAGKQYEVYIYFHNDASLTYNDAAHNYAGVARNVRLSSNFPDELKKGEVGIISGKITAENTDPLQVWDEAYITASEDMTLHYVTGSAKIYNGWAANGSVLSTNLFSNTGTFLGEDELNGVIPGCDVFSGHVIYVIQTVAVTPDPVGPTDSDPDPEPEEDEPEPVVEPVVPEALPVTGPAEVFLAVALVVVVVAGVAYYVKTQKAVKNVTKKAKGRK